MKTVIEMAREAGATPYTNRHYPDRPTHTFNPDQLERLVELVRADEAKRADAMAATIAGLRDIVTSDAESKVEFIARVRNVLGACPDLRVLHAVKAEREACAKVCHDASVPVSGELQSDAQWSALCLATAIRARGNT